MRYRDSIFVGLLKPIDRRRFAAVVDRHDGDAYDKEFDSWDHLVALIHAQLSGAQSLRGIEQTWEANAHHHYHLGVGEVCRSTLSDANQRRPVEVFLETFEMLAGRADRMLRREGAEMVRLIDATPIPLGDLCRWSKWNGRIKGLKLHVVYDPRADMPRRIEITPANVNDISFGRSLQPESGATYVMDKAYCHYGWWQELHSASAFFVTRQKSNMRLKSVGKRPLKKRKGDGFAVLDDHLVKLVSKGNAKLPIAIRRIRVKRATGGTIALLTNDLSRPAVEIAALYKERWQIELLFRWIKQHLRIRKFLGKSENAVRLQLVAAMIAYLLLRLAARQNRITLAPIRFAELVGQGLFVRKPIAHIDKPPEVNPSKAKPNPDQMVLAYA